MRPVRDRYKVFIIDEVHQLSAQSFNALLKSIEEPPAHVVFILATTELHKIPDTIRSQRAGVRVPHHRDARAIAGQLRTIAEAEKIDRHRGRARAAGPLRRRQHARRRERVRSGDLVCGRRGDGRRRGRGARSGRPRPALRHPDRRGRRGRRAGVRAGGPRRRGRLRPADPLPGDRGARARHDARLDRPVAADRPRSRVRVRSRSAQGPDGAVLARGPAAIVRPVGEGRAGRARGVAAALRARDGAGEVDSPAKAGADLGADRRPRAWRRVVAGAGATPTAVCAATSGAVRWVRRAAGVWRAAARRQPAAPVRRSDGSAGSSGSCRVRQVQQVSGSGGSARVRQVQQVRPVRFRPTSRNAFSPRFSGRTARSTRCTSHRRSGSRWTRGGSSSRSVPSTRRCASRWSSVGSGSSRSRSPSLAGRSRWRRRRGPATRRPPSRLTPLRRASQARGWRRYGGQAWRGRRRFGGPA